MSDPGEDDDYFDMLNDAPDDDDEDAEAEMNCGEMPGGGCSLAGTEWCDWSCPFSDGMAKRAPRRKKYGT